MDIDYSLNSIRIKKTGFFYQGERQVKYSEFKKLSDSARQKKRWRVLIVKPTVSWANKMAKKSYRFYLGEMAREEMEAVKFQSETVNFRLLDKETLVGLSRGTITQNILEGLRTGVIARKTIRDAYVNSILENFDRKRYLSWDFYKFVMKRRQFGSKSLSDSETSDEETN